MPQVVLYGGSRVAIPDAEEIEQAADARERERYRGVKVMRLPQIFGKASGNALSIGQAFQAGPESGYAWSLRRVIVSGMTTGGTPDVVNLYVSDTGSQPLWQFNGNNFGYTFGPGEIVVNPGEILLLASVGVFTATGTITLSGSVVEVPAEMLGKLAVA